MHETHDAGARRVRPILLAAAAVLVALAYTQVRSSLGHEAKRPGAPGGERFGNGVVVRGDGVGYYAWLRSLLIDGDWQFDNEFDELNPTGSWVPTARTPAGYRANQWSVGPPCVWSPVVASCHALVSSGAFGSYAPDGFSLPYQLAVALVGLAGGLVALVLMFRIGCRFADPVAAAAAAACVALGSTFAYYTAVEPSLAHGLAATALLLFVAYWLRDFGSVSVRRWLVLGGLLGASALMRWQLATFGVVLIGELVWTASTARPRPSVGRFCRVGAALGAGLFVGVLPQLVAWRIVYGAWLVEPMPLAHNWLAPDIGRVLVSFERGFFYWTPITLLAVLGTLVAVRRGTPERRVQAGLLLFAVGVQVYALASLTGPGVFLGAAYGYRFLTESAVLLVPGLATVFALRSRWAAGAVTVGCVLVGWNLLLMGAYRYGQLPDTAAPAELWRAVRWYATSALTYRERAWIGVAACAFFAAVLRCRWSRFAVTEAPAARSADPAPVRRAA
ncbi:MAG: hypothetical protein J0I06_25315 [Planctomycetes bacterium]|nr:hypothetical protein [Planctomycetota bacterium]